MILVKHYFSKVRFSIYTCCWGAWMVLLLLGCGQDHPIVETASLSPEEREIIDYLRTNDYDLDAVEFLEDFVVYEADAGWDKAALLRTIRGENIDPIPIDPDDPSIVDLEAEERHRGIREENRTDAVTKGRVDDLTYFMRSSLGRDCGTDWTAAFRNGAREWNRLAHCRVTLTETTSEIRADIVIGSDLDTGLPTSHRNIPSIARAGFPSDGRAWGWISVNDNADDWDSKLKTAMHEFGHCLGYRHTGTSDGQFIHGTPSTESGSIMNQGTNTSPSFQTGDRRSARVYYPEEYTDPNSVSVRRESSGKVRLTYRNSNFITRPYYWIRVYKYTSWGVYLGYRDFKSRTGSSDGFHTLFWGGHTPGRTYKFAVRGYNFRRDINSGRSSKFSVDL
ncbi:MAG: M57 family metalloprotease [Bacteroidota bacterium]